MAGSSLLTLVDDIATLLDDIAAMSKVAAGKTAGVLGDDLALNAEQVAGVNADRELPVVWAVAKGSLRNKLILVPAALAISAVMPWAVTALLMLGGVYLCFEGFEKLAHKFMHGAAEAGDAHAQHLQALASPAVDMLEFEKDKIRGAIRTDFILSAEIIVITLGTVAAAPFLQQLTVLSVIAIVMTIGVYGLVAGIVKLDDAGLYLSKRQGGGVAGKLQRQSGGFLLLAAPLLMKCLSVVGTAAMFTVGGGILVHGLPPVHHLAEAATSLVQGWPVAGGVLGALAPVLLSALAGIAAGAGALAGITLVGHLRKRLQKG